MGVGDGTLDTGDIIARESGEGRKKEIPNGKDVSNEMGARNVNISTMARRRDCVTQSRKVFRRWKYLPGCGEANILLVLVVLMRMKN